jgi:hypothetical protein
MPETTRPDATNATTPAATAADADPTPFHWHIEQMGNYYYRVDGQAELVQHPEYTIVRDDGQLPNVCSVYAFPGHPDLSTRIANLIVASPDLLQAARHALYGLYRLSEVPAGMRQRSATVENFCFNWNWGIRPPECPCTACELRRAITRAGGTF